LNGGVLNGRVSLETILKAEYWKTGLFGSLQYYWQASLMQPTGGMDMIWHAFLRQPVPGGGTIKETVTLNSPVRSVRNLEVNGAKKVEVIHGAPGGEAVTDIADFCISTMAPIQLVQAGENFSTGFVNALAAIAYRPATKVGLQMSNRFWETEDRIYGGISWIRDDVSQVWYPSSDFHSKNGVLTAAYNNGPAAARFGAMPIEARIEAALSAGEKLHPGEYRENYTPSTALALAWQNMPHFIGGWADDQAEDQPDVYKAMVDAIPDGQVYLAGDFFSYWPGWQEGSVTSAELATKLILERTSAG
jgi:monoamine oxidase